MKTKLLLSLCLMFVLSFQMYAQFTEKKAAAPTQAASQTTRADESQLIYSLCGSEVEAGSGVDRDVEIKAFIRIPAGQWKGCKITKVEIGLGYEAGKDSYVFIAKDLEEEPLVKIDFRSDTIPPVPSDEDWLIGWKEVPLTTPYTIDQDDDLYVGWYTIQTSYGPIGTDWEDLVNGGATACYRRPGSTEWTYQNLAHNICIKVTIEGENLPQNHLRVSSYSVDKLYYKTGETVNLSGAVINEGLLPVNSFDFTYQLNDDEAVTNHIADLDLQPMQTYSFNYQMPINKEGKGSIILTVSNPNGKADDYPESATTTFSTFGCLTKGLQKTVLVDELVGTDDTGAQAANEIIATAIENSDRKENVIWVQNHALAKDEYTIKGYGNYDYLFNGPIFTPSINIDHQRIPDTFMLNDDNEKVPATSEMFIIDENFGTHLETCLNRDDVYFSLGLECSVVDDDILKIKMTATPAIEGLFPTMLKPCIALLLTEDKVVGKQAGVEGDYIHNGVPRAFINDGNPAFAFIGDEVPFPSEGFTLETKYIIPNPSWKLENMNLIFYVIDGNVIIQNAVTCPIIAKDPDAIENVKESNSEFTVRCNNGMLHIEGEFDQARIFTISGQQVIATNEADTNISKLVKGIYCVLIQKGNRFVSEKFIVD